MWCVASVLAIGALFAYLYWDSRKRERQRRLVIRALLSRPETPVESQCYALAKGDAMMTATLTRIWLLLAQYYEIPASRIAANDGLCSELKGVYGHPDYELTHFCFGLSTYKAAHRSPWPSTWGELVLRLYECELEAGRQLV